MISVADLQKSFGARSVLAGVGFDLQAGDIAVLAGINGAGKTTLLRVLCGLESAQAGKVSVETREEKKPPRRNARQSGIPSHVGYLPAESPVAMDLRTEEYLRYRSGLRGLSNDTDVVSKIIEEMNLQEVRGRIIGKLSTGLRQRIALADVLLARPKLLLLDEPTRGLDPIERDRFREILLRGRAQRSVLLASHALEEQIGLANRYLFLHHGKIADEGRIADELGDGLSLRKRFRECVAQ